MSASSRVVTPRRQRLLPLFLCGFAALRPLPEYPPRPADVSQDAFEQVGANGGRDGLAPAEPGRPCPSVRSRDQGPGVMERFLETCSQINGFSNYPFVCMASLGDATNGRILRCALDPACCGGSIGTVLPNAAPRLLLRRRRRNRRRRHRYRHRMKTKPVFGEMKRQHRCGAGFHRE